MPQTIHRGIKALIDEANAQIETVGATEAIKAAQSDDQEKKFIFHCAGGMRSALAAKTAQDMGLKPVAHMGGGFAAWRDAGGPVEKVEPKKPKG